MTASRSLVSLLVFVALGSLFAGCASPRKRSRERPDPPERERVSDFDDEGDVGPATWTQPRDERRFADWPDVSSASAAAVDGHLSTADRRFDAEDFHGSIEAYSRALVIDPSNSYAYCNRGSARRRLGDYEGAIADLTRAIELRPDYALAYNNRGYALMRSNDPEGAIEDYGQAIRLGDTGFPSYNLAMTYRNRAKAWRMLGEDSKARRDDDMALHLRGRRPRRVR